MDTQEEKPDVVDINQCECGCTSMACSQLRLENQELRDKLQKLQVGTTAGRETDELSLASPGEKNDSEINGLPAAGNEKKEPNFPELSQEQVKGDYDDVVKKNQELENRILQLAGELQLEKSHFEETVGAMSEQLMDFVEKMNKLERESMKNKKDCSLVVQLLKCNQSLDRKFVSQKMDMLPAELKDKLTTELDIEQESEPLSHPAWSRRLWRTKSTGSHAEGNAKTGSRSKSFHSRTMNE
ncbi:hypothetical protein OS493_022642 [Desmophyllum pertusum]|uniref:Uncharacterized protein n=1 Tax=Desmophyllum pertusum TaxID=174260 RepID=A0A9X0CLR4_9CNID|nr:hypothetical protein OS493_022642 [Desmophyllum pertusum]